MLRWENKPIIVKDNYAQAKTYFENLVKDFKTYTQNSGGKTRKMVYESANHMADICNKIRKYIQDIASATVANKERTAEVAANISEASRAKDAQIESITAQIKLLTDTITLLSKLLANKENNSGGGNSSERNGGNRNGGNGGGLGGRHI
jgi:methyl-accepting chemotaxis protein